MVFLELSSLLLICFQLSRAQNTCPCNTFTEIERECEVYMSESECLPEKKILGGRVSDITRWPYLISFQLPYNSECFYHFCAGTLIAHNLVLTAAHCFDGFLLDTEANVSSLNIAFYAAIAPPCRHLGSGRRNAVSRAFVKHVHISPEWSRDESSGDIAIAVLDKSFPDPFPNIIQQSDQLDKSTQLTVAGWGAIDTQEAQNEFMYNLRQLYEADLMYTSESLCQLFLTQFGVLPGILDYATMMCAYNPESDTCGGDSGGPVVIKGVNNPSEDVVVGIVSWGPRRQCLSKSSGQAPAVLTRVSAFSDWINYILEEYKKEDDNNQVQISGQSLSQSKLTPQQSSPNIQPTRFLIMKPNVP